MNQPKIVTSTVLLLIVLILFSTNLSAAQSPLQLKVNNDPSVSVLPANVVWEKTYGGVADDRAFYALPTDDGYLVVGSSRSIAANTTVGWALKLNGDGDAVWNRTFLEGYGTELRYAVNLTDGYLLVGNEFFASGEVQGYVAKVDNQGALLWKTILGAGKTDKLFSGMATTDGFVVFGLASVSSNGESGAWVVKLDTSGNVVWSKTYGQSTDSALRSGVLAQNGDYVVAGYIAKADGNYDFYLLELSTSGNVIWNQTYGTAGSQKAYSITKANDGYVVVGDIQSPNAASDAWMLKVDPSGNMVWNKTIGGKDADSAAYVTSSKDGGYLVAGFTFSFGAGNRDFWLFKISDAGQVLWSCTRGDQGFQEAYGVIESGDNQYVMVGWTDPPGQPALIGKATYDFYVVKLSPAQNSSGLSNFQYTIYALAIFAVLLVTMLLLFKLRAKRRR